MAKRLLVHSLVLFCILCLASGLAGAQGTSQATKTSASNAASNLVDINSATKEQLDALPEIGPVKAQAIIDGRPYKKIEDIMKVKGIKQGTFNKIKDSITVE